MVLNRNVLYQHVIDMQKRSGTSQFYLLASNEGQKIAYLERFFIDWEASESLLSSPYVSPVVPHQKYEGFP